MKFHLVTPMKFYMVPPINFHMLPMKFHMGSLWIFIWSPLWIFMWIFYDFASDIPPLKNREKKFQGGVSVGNRTDIGSGFSRPKSRICWLLRDKKIAKGWITLFFQKKIIIQLIGPGGKVDEQRQRCSTFCWETSQKQQNEARCAGLLERQGWRYGHGMKIGRRRKVLANLHPNGILTVGIFDTKLPFKTTHKWRYFSCVEFTLKLMNRTTTLAQTAKATGIWKCYKLIWNGNSSPSTMPFRLWASLS